MNFDSSVLQVAIEDIIPNRFQPRLAFEDASLNELANSIRQHGIIQPLVLRKIGDKYEIIAGERRYKAATMAGLSSVPAVISQIDDKTSAEVAVVENVQRRDLTAIEEAKSYKALLDQGFMSQEQLAKRMGLSQSAISNKLRLLSLAPEVQNAILENKISERHARALLIIKEPESQVKWLNRILEERLTVRLLDEELKKEYREDAMNTNINIEQIKQNATDIPFVAPINDTAPTESNPFAMGPINLGQKQTNKFFNNLEDEAVNMQMTEAINPFLQASNPVPAGPVSIDGFSVASINQPEDVQQSIESETEEIQPAPISESDEFSVNNAPEEIESITANEEVKEVPIEPINEQLPLESTVETPAPQPEVNEIDSLDFTPPQEEVTLTNAKNKIDNLVNELKNENYKIEFAAIEANDQITYTIIIKKPEN